jgi:hypothetical protein
MGEDMLVLPPASTLTREDEAVLGRFLSLPVAAFLSKSDAVYRVVCWAPAQHGYPPQVTVANPNGLPLCIDLIDPEEEEELAPISRAA